MKKIGILGIILIITFIVAVSGCTEEKNTNSTSNNTMENNSSSVGAINITNATIEENGKLVVKFNSEALKGYDLEDSSQIGIEYYLTDKDGYRDNDIAYPTGSYSKAKMETYLDTGYEEKGYKSVEIAVYYVPNNTVIAKGQSQLQ